LVKAVHQIPIEEWFLDEANRSLPHRHNRHLDIAVRR